MPEKHIAIIDFEDGHVEQIYAQAAFLKDSDYTVHLIIPESAKKRVAIYDKVDHFVYIPKNLNNDFRAQKVAFAGGYLDKNNIKTVIINTYSSSFMRMFLKYSAGRRVFACLHGIEKVSGNFWFWIISRRVRNYFVLYDHLLELLPPRRKLKFESLYPIYYPEYPLLNIPKNENEFWITVPGQLEYVRRNYVYLLEEMNEDLNPNIRFIILGRSKHRHGDGVDFEKRIDEKGMADRFILFDEFIEENLFRSYVRKSDLLMPLLKDRERYLKEGISGTFNLAFAYKIPMLVEKEYSGIEDLRLTSFLYDVNELTGLLNSLYENRTLVFEKKTEMESYKKLSYEYQRKKYVSFIEST